MRRCKLCNVPISGRKSKIFCSKSCSDKHWHINTKKVHNGSFYRTRKSIKIIKKMEALLGEAYQFVDQRPSECLQAAN